MKMRKKSLDKNEIELLDKYFRACNYLSAAQLYLLDNPLLKEKLTMKTIPYRIFFAPILYRFMGFML